MRRAFGLWVLVACAHARTPSVDAIEYVVVATPHEIAVDVTLPRGSVLEIAEPAALRGLAIDGRAGELGARCDEPCRVTYRVDVSALADVVRAGDAAVTTLAPILVRPGTAAQFRVRGSAFTTSLRRDGDGYRGSYEDLDATFAIGPVRTLSVNGATLDLAFVPGPRASSDDAIVAWVDRSARAVAGYYARRPFSRALITVQSYDEDEIFGLTDHHGEGSMALHFGPESRVDGEDDWVATHELLHLSFPFVGRRHAWMSEGMATYVEPIARARIKQLDEQTLWRDFFRNMPKGQPSEGDEGLERTRTWGRVYWGGALFFLVADVELRVRTKNALGLEHALRGLPSGGSSTVEDVIRLGDAATKTTVLADLYAKYGLRSERVDLDALFARLGVRESSLDDTAELAAVRRAIVKPDG